MATFDRGTAWTLPDPALVPVRGGGAFLALVGRLDRFAGLWTRLRAQSPELIDRLQEIATIQSVASSTRIEGAQLSDEEVRNVLAGVHMEGFRARDEQEVRGYRDLLQIIRDNHEALTVTESVIKEFHRVLLAHSETDAQHRGDYKKQPNDIQKSGAGLPVVVFRTAPPAETRWWMERIVAELNAAWDDASWHPLILISDFVLWFLAIHPFLEGNGRLARALTQFLLLKAGYTYVPFASLERVVEDRQSEYYLSLQHSQLAATTDAADYAEWLWFLLSALDEQQRLLEARLTAAGEHRALPRSQARIVEVITTQGAMTTPEIAEALAMSPRTVRYHLARLVAARLLDAPSKTAGRRYSLPLENAIPAAPTAAAAAPLAPSPRRGRDPPASGRLLTPLDLAGYAQHINSSPNGRAYATVVLVGPSDAVRRPLGDVELDAFEDFCGTIAPASRPVRATPEVGWWHVEDPSSFDKLQLWLYPGPLIQVHWALDNSEGPDDAALTLDPIDLVVYWRWVLRCYVNFASAVAISQAVIALNLQTIPSGRAPIVGLSFSQRATPTRSGRADSAPPPWSATLTNVSTSELLNASLLSSALDQLLRHFSYRHTHAAIEATVQRATARGWDPSTAPAEVISRRNMAP
ncbi:MAG: Fic family protein [Candidatus Dormibacteria bacterium]